MLDSQVSAPEVSSAWVCPHGPARWHPAYQDLDGWWCCRSCGATDNGLRGAEPYQSLSTGQKGQERLQVSHLGAADEMEVEMEKFRQLRYRLRRRPSGRHPTDKATREQMPA